MVTKDSKPIFSCSKLKIYSWLGFFPCYISVSNDFERPVLIPINWKLQIILYLFSTLLSFGLFMGLLVYLRLEYGLTILQIFKCVISPKDINVAFDLSNILFTITIILSVLQHFSLHYGNIQMKQNLVELQKPFRNLKNDRDKYSKRSALLSLLLFLMSLFFAMGFTLNLKYALDFSYFTVFYCGFSITLQLIWEYFPCMVFYYIFSETCKGIEAYVHNLKQELKSTQKVTNSVVIKSYKLLSLLDESVKTLSRNVFYIMVLPLVLLTCGVYMTFDYFLAHTEVTPGIVCVILAYLSFIIFLAYIVWIFNHDSQHLTDEIYNLKKLIEEIDIEDHEFMLVKAKLQDVNSARARIIRGLEGFNGFDGLGYFSLGKSLLTSITSNILTYLIVLIQFRISEK